MQKHGFTLVELSIVLIIIGLLLGGVLAGRDLIRAAELRGMLSQQENYKTAMMAFREKYRCMPGDCASAHQFFGSACGDSTTDPDTGCNGDGDGFNRGDMDLGEQLKFWMHLSMASLVQGNFSGRGDATGDGPAAVIGENVPSAKISGLGWNGIVSGEASSYNGDMANNAIWGVSYAGNNTVTHAQLYGGPFVSRSDAYNMDSKVDDGLPDTGKVRADQRGDCNSSYDASQNTYFALMAPGANPDLSLECQQSFIF